MGGREPSEGFEVSRDSVRATVYLDVGGEAGPATRIGDFCTFALTSVCL